MRPPSYCPILLEAVVGSTAYGLATADSDIDKLGIFVQPTSDFWLLNKPRETWTHDDRDPDDYTYHEIEKYIRLALKCNPTVLELLFLDEHTVVTDFGQDLINKRGAFLSRGYVRNAYLGYATEQLHRVMRAGQPKSSELWHKRAKNARHLWRLLKQGTELLTTGCMQPRLNETDVALCRLFGQGVADGDIDWGQDELRAAEGKFEKYIETSPLPESPQSDTVEIWLLNLRQQMLVPTKGLNYVQS